MIQEEPGLPPGLFPCPSLVLGLEKDDRPVVAFDAVGPDGDPPAHRPRQVPVFRGVVVADREDQTLLPVLVPHEEALRGDPIEGAKVRVVVAHKRFLIA